MVISKKLIYEVARKIVKNADPEKIVLFGSFAWGTPSFDSDLDILVIKKSKLRRDKRTLKIDKLFADRQFPLDVVVYTPKEVGECLKMEGSFVKDILENGKILYERVA